eukprot:767022-Hanusia_phi.AAC.2
MKKFIVRDFIQNSTSHNSFEKWGHLPGEHLRSDVIRPSTEQEQQYQGRRRWYPSWIQERRWRRPDEQHGGGPFSDLEVSTSGASHMSSPPSSSWRACAASWQQCTVLPVTHILPIPGHKINLGNQLGCPGWPPVLLVDLRGELHYVVTVPLTISHRNGLGPGQPIVGGLAHTA